MFTTICLPLLLLCCSLLSTARAEVIYDNTQTILGAGPAESQEYGDQLDLQGIARTLTSLTFYYYGDFLPDGQTLTLRLYNNETPYDNFRKSPTTLLYESGHIPMSTGYNSGNIDNLSVKLPLDTVTVTVQFNGLKTNEFASLVLCHPPTIGSSFNEFWERNSNGHWAPFYYSKTDFNLKANAGLRLVAETEAVLASGQNDSSAAIALHTPTNSVRLAQTFTPSVNGRVDTLSLTLNPSGVPLQLTILDTVNGIPGANVLGRSSVETTNSGQVTISLYDAQIYLQAGTQYAVEIASESAQNDPRPYLVSCSAQDSYSDGQLWSRKDSNAQWEPAALSEGSTSIDATFNLLIVPAAPPIRIISPLPGELIPFEQNVRFEAELHLPSISTLYRVRFFDGNNELEQLINPPHANPPYDVVWKATNAGPHTLSARAEDAFGRPFRAEELTVTVLPPQVARAISAERTVAGAVVLHFATVAGEQIRIEYSEDCEHWKPAQTEVVGTGDDITYLDQGPPNTESDPKDAKRRFYRALFKP